MIASDILYRNDVLGRFLLRKLRLSPLKVGLIPLAYYSVFLPLAETYIRRTYGGEYFGLKEHELINAIIVVLFTAIIWWFYSWQLANVPTVYSELLRNEVIGEPLDTDQWNSLAEFLQLRLVRGCSFPWQKILATIVTLGGYVFFTIGAYKDRAAGLPYWFIVYEWIYYIFYLPPLVISTYAIIVAALREIVITFAFNTTFREFRTNVHPLHSDGAGGLGPLGRFAITVGSLVLYVGLWVNTMVFSPVLFGQAPGFNMISVGNYAVYIALGPLLVLTPIIEARRVMMAAKKRELQTVADAFNRLFAESQQELGTMQNEATLQSQSEGLVELKRRYTLIEETFPTLPFTIPQVRGLSLTAVIPLVPGAISTVVELFRRLGRTG